MSETEDPKTEMAGTLAKLVGATVIYYAMVEHWIDGIVFCIHDCVAGAREIEKRHPYNAKAEFDFLRASFGELPDLEPFKAEALGAAGQTGALG